MTEPIWLDKATLIMAHDFEIKRHGGSYGIRDRSLLDSAMAKPKNLYVYENADICDLAAAYAYGIAKNHPFVDGNKRTSFVSAALFLELNNKPLHANKAEAVVMTVGMANDEISQDGYARWLRDNC